MKKKSKRILAFIAAVIMMMSTCFTALAAAPVPEENYSLADFFELVDYYLRDIVEGQDVWEIDDGYLDPANQEEGHLFVDKAYVDALRQTAQEIWDIDSDEEAEDFEKEDNRDYRQQLYEELKSLGDEIVDNIKTGTRPKALDEHWGKLDNAWKRLDEINSTYGDVNDSDNPAQNVYIIMLEEGEELNEERIRVISADFFKGTYWILGEYWEQYWTGKDGNQEGMDSVFQLLEQCGTKLEEIEQNGASEGTEDELALIDADMDTAMNRAEEMLNYLESHLYEGSKATEGKEPAAKKKSSGRSSRKETEEEPVVVVNQVITSDGKIITSSLDGINASVKVKAAVKTSREQCYKAAGIDTGSKLSLYVSDGLIKENAKLVMSDVAGMLGRKQAAIFHMDLYEISEKAIENRKETLEPIEIVLRIPDNYIAEGRVFCILVPDGKGGVIELVDLDGDSRTITVLAQNFGVCALVYQN